MCGSCQCCGRARIPRSQSPSSDPRSSWRQTPLFSRSRQRRLSLCSTTQPDQQFSAPGPGDCDNATVGGHLTWSLPRYAERLRWPKGAYSCAPPLRVEQRRRRRQSGSTHHDGCSVLAAKPSASEPGHRPGTVPLALVCFIPGSQQAPDNAATPCSLAQLSAIALSTEDPTHSCQPHPPPSPCPPQPNPHRARCAVGAPLTAISCLGAFRTPAVGARGWARHAGVRKPAKRPAVHQVGRGTSATGAEARVACCRRPLK
jgi:hypothetical protein